MRPSLLVGAVIALAAFQGAAHAIDGSADFASVPDGAPAGLDLAAPPAAGGAPEPPLGQDAAFEKAASLFEAHCTQCHGGAHPKMRLNLERENVYRTTLNVRSRTSKRQSLIVPGDPWASALYLRLLPPSVGAYRGPRMPMKGSLTEDEIQTVRAWIESFPVSARGHAAGGPAGEKAAPEPAPGSATGEAPPPAEGEPTETSSKTAEEPPALYAPLFHDRFLAHIPSPDTLGKQNLEFRFSHRFRAGASDAGADNLWGLDGGAWISIGLAYGIWDRFDVGIRRTNQMQDYEGYFKAALIRQRAGESPISLAFFGSFMRLDGDGVENRNRWAEQIIIARRFAEWLSIEIVPTYVSRTNFLDEEDDEGTLALGVAAEVRLNSYLALTGEWIGQSGVRAPWQVGSVGFSVRTSNHAFHLVLTNALNTHTDLYAPGGDLDWGDGDFRIGFNISRTFEPMQKP